MATQWIAIVVVGSRYHSHIGPCSAACRMPGEINARSKSRGRITNLQGLEQLDDSRPIQAFWQWPKRSPVKISGNLVCRVCPGKILPYSPSMSREEIKRLTELSSCGG